MLQTGTPVSRVYVCARVCVRGYVRGPPTPPGTTPLVHLCLSQTPFQRSTLPYCKFYGSCIKLWSCPGIDPARPPTIWICGPRAYTLCTFLIKRYCNCGLTSKHHGLQQRLYSRLPHQSSNRRRRCSLRVLFLRPPRPYPFHLLQLYRTFFGSFDDSPRW